MLDEPLDIRARTVRQSSARARAARDVAQELQELGCLAEGAGDNLDAERRHARGQELGLLAAALVVDLVLAALMLAALAPPARRTELSFQEHLNGCL